MLLIVAWRVNFLLHMSRIMPDISYEFFFEPSEWKAGYIAATRDRKYPSTPPTLQKMMGYIAKLGGHLGRKNDPDPGSTVIWKGICKLTKMRMLGIYLDQKHIQKQIKLSQKLMRKSMSAPLR
jgi:hypothetical protein